MPGGRPNKPTELKRRQGTLRKSRTNKSAPKLPPGAPPMPAGLDVGAQAEWRRLVATCLAMRVLTTSDRGIVEAAARAYSIMERTGAVLSTLGDTYETTNTNGDPVFKARPEYQQHADAWRRYFAALVQLGLTPAAREKVSTIDPAEDEDPGAAYFN